MPTQKRPPETGVIGRLFEQPQQFELAQAVRLLLRWLGRRGVPPDAALSDILRFQNSLSLSFPASQIEALASDADAAGPPASIRPGGAQLPRIVLTPAIMGLLGVAGTLPFHDTERIAAAQWRDKDDGPRAFLDLFSHRLVSLFCRAWGKYRLEYALDTGARDTQLPLLLALAGMRADTLESSGIAADVGAYYAGLLRTRPVSAAIMSRVLSHHFQVPVTLEQFVGCWDPIAPNRRSTLGGVNPTLGHSATLGVRLWRHDRRARLVIGPLDRATLERFLPQGTAARSLARLLMLFAEPMLEYELQLLLKPPCVRPLQLSTRNHATSCRLGWDSFMPHNDGSVDRPAISYLLRPTVDHADRAAP